MSEIYFIGAYAKIPIYKNHTNHSKRIALCGVEDPSSPLRACPEELMGHMLWLT
jgi:hypothetical protein